MGSWAFSFKLGAAIVSGTFAFVILAGGRRAPNRYLGIFLLLIAANQAIEALRYLQTASQEVPSRQLAAIAAAADPFFLYYFASIFPSRNRLNHPLLVGLVLGMSSVLVLAAGFLPFRGVLTGAPAVHQLVWAVFTAAVYLTVLVRFILASRDAQSPRSLHLLVVALSIATLPAVSRIVTYWDPQSATWAGRENVSAVLIPIVFGAAIALLGLRWRSRHPRLASTLLVSSLVGVLLTETIYMGSIYQILLGQGLVSDFPFLARLMALVNTSSAPIRWILFGALGSMAVVRDRLLDMSQAARRWAARILVGEMAAFAGFALLASAHAASGEGFRLVPVDLVIVLLLVALTQTSDSIIDQAARRLYRVPSPGNRAAAEDLYRTAVLQALDEGRDVEHDPAAARLQQELALDAETATWIRSAAVASIRGPLRPGIWIQGRYRVDRLLARGGFGRTFLAHDRVLDRKVVVKEVLEAEGAGLQKGLEEARFAGSLQHPNVLVVHDAIRGPGSVLLVEEYLEGGSLQDRLEREGPLPWDEASEILLQVLNGLEAVHRRGIIHRDIKPSNILFDAQGRAKIADFGTARARRSATLEAAHAPTFAGTLEYMSPEQRQGRPVGAASDLYQVGRLFLAVARKPVPSGLKAVLDRALRPSPGRRWPAAADFHRALEGARLEAVRPPRRAGFPSPEPKGARKRPSQSMAAEKGRPRGSSVRGASHPTRL